jgi:ABC-type transport system substrate-binding protein
MLFATPQGTLRVTVSVMPNAIDLPMSSERNAHNVSWQMYDPLVWTDETGKSVPALAQSWTVSDDGTAYTFKLRKDVVKQITYPVDRVYYIAFNNLTSGKGQPTENPLVRQAMNYAVDVDSIIDALLNGHGKPIAGFVTSGNWGYDKSNKPFGYDPDKAKKLWNDKNIEC